MTTNIFFANGIEELTTTTGTGNITLAGPIAGQKPVSSIVTNGGQIGYFMHGYGSGAVPYTGWIPDLGTWATDPYVEWESGIGTWLTGNILQRTQVDASSNGGALVNFSAGTKVVSIRAPNNNADGFTVAELLAVRAKLNGILISTSRTALATDNYATLELANGVTYTLSGSVALPAGITVVGPASGTATLAASSCTINGTGTSITLTAGQMYSVIPRVSSPTAFIAKGS